MSDQSSTAYAGDRAAALIGEPYKAELREIVVFLDGRTEAKGILEFAGVLAQEHGAHLIGVFIQPEPAVTPPETFARGTGILSVIEAHRAQLEGIEAEHRALFEDIVRRQGIRSEWRSLSYLSSDVAEHAHYADLAVIARADPADQTGGPVGLVESLVLTSGRPIIMFPPQGTVSRVRRIVVGWNARREAIRAVADALPLLVRAEVVEVLVRPMLSRALSSARGRRWRIVPSRPSRSSSVSQVLPGESSSVHRAQEFPLGERSSTSWAHGAPNAPFERTA